MSEHKKMNTAKNTLPQKMNLLPIILEVVAEQTENFDFRGEVFLTSFVGNYHILKINSFYYDNIHYLLKFFNRLI